MWFFTVGKDFVLGIFSFGAIKLTKNADFEKYKYSKFGSGYDVHGSFSLSNGSGFGKDPTEVLDVSKLTAEKKYSINFTEKQKSFV